MNIPKQAQAILRRMRRRGYTDQYFAVIPRRKGRPREIHVTIMWPAGEKPPNGKRHFAKLGPSWIACCRDIEKQWKAEQ